MALPFTTYATIVAGEGLLGRVTGALKAARQTEAETYALRKVQGWLREHLDEPDDSVTGRTPQERLDDLEAFWDANAIDPLIVAFALAIGEMRYLQTQGHYDGKTGSPGFHARTEHKGEVWAAEIEVLRQKKLALSTSGIDGEHLLVRRFTEL